MLLSTLVARLPNCRYACTSRCAQPAVQHLRSALLPSSQSADPTPERSAGQSPSRPGHPKRALFAPASFGIRVSKWSTSPREPATSSCPRRLPRLNPLPALKTRLHPLPFCLLLPGCPDTNPEAL